MVETIAWAPVEATASINTAVNGPDQEQTLMGPFFASAGQRVWFFVFFERRVRVCGALPLHFHPVANRVACFSAVCVC